jgi:phage tail-like protein
MFGFGEKDPLVQFSYSIEIQGILSGYFTECSGLGSEHEVIEHKVVDTMGRQDTVYVPGRLKWPQISLKRGITDNMDIWHWRKMVEDGNVDLARANGSVVMMDQHLTPTARWDFEEAWPIKVSGPQLKSDSNQIGVEELVIVHRRLWRVIV